MKVAGIFPIPIGMSNINRPFTDIETNFFAKILGNLKPNQGNETSVDTYILEHPEMADIKAFVLNGIKEYLNETNPLPDDLDIYITQSWINVTKNGGWHHGHVHSNSIVSGTIYINANETHDCVWFNNYNNYIKLYNITFEPKRHTMFNQPHAEIKVNTGDLLLFPSPIHHQVPESANTDLRISLSFNTFFKGHLGASNYLTELIL